MASLRSYEEAERDLTAKKHVQQVECMVSSFITGRGSRGILVTGRNSHRTDANQLISVNGQELQDEKVEEYLTTALKPFSPPEDDMDLEEFREEVYLLMLSAIAYRSKKEAIRLGKNVALCGLTWDGNDSKQTKEINARFHIECLKGGSEFFLMAHPHPGCLKDDVCNVLQHFEFKCTVVPKMVWVHAGYKWKSLNRTSVRTIGHHAYAESGNPSDNDDDPVDDDDRPIIHNVPPPAPGGVWRLA